MRTFKDSARREWTVALTTAANRRVKGLIGAYPADLLMPAPGAEPDMAQLADLLFALVKPQADAAGVTDEQFGEALDGDAFAAGLEAATEACIDFFPPDRRATLREARAKLKAAEADLGLRAVEKLEALTAAALASALSGLAGSAPGSPASTPTPAPSAS
jgi:hypothetical protein